MSGSTWATDWETDRRSPLGNGQACLYDRPDGPYQWWLTRSRSSPASRRPRSEAITFLLLFFPLVFLFGIVGFVMALTARGRLSQLERRLGDLEARFEGRATAEQAVATPIAAAAAHTEPAAPRAKRRTGDLEQILGGQWLTWLGVLAVFVGTAFFLAIDLGTSPLAGPFQVLAGLIVGMLFLLSGRILAGRLHGVLGQGLLGCGVALLFLAAYGAYGFHALVPAPVAYVFLLGVAVAGAMVALRRDSYAVAVLTMIGAVMTPALLPVPGDPAHALAPYLLAINIGGAMVATRRAWSAVPLGLFIGTVLVIAGWWDEHFGTDKRAIALVMIGLPWLLYAVMPLVVARRHDWWGVARSTVTVANGLLVTVALLAWLRPDLEHLQGLMVALLAAIYVVGARVAQTRMGESPAIWMTHHTGLALATIAMAAHFDASWITLAWCVFGLALLLAGLRMPSRNHRLAAFAILFLAVLRMLFVDTGERFVDAENVRTVFNSSFLVSLVVLAVLCVVAWLLVRHRDRLSPFEQRLSTPLVVAAALLLLVRISVESIAHFDARADLLGESMRKPSLLTLSLIWVTYAGALITAGFVARFRPVRMLGIVVLGVLVLKMLLLDFSVLEAGYRIASFFGVGLMLLAISVLYQRERRP